MAKKIKPLEWDQCKKDDKQMFHGICFSFCPFNGNCSLDKKPCLADKK